MKLIFLKKIINSFLYPRFLYEKLINDATYEMLIQKKLPSKVLRKLIYFYPSVSESYSWIHGDVNEWRDPTDFLKLRPGIDDVFLDYFDKNIQKNDKILDLACNSGRHLNGLYKKKYKDLNGVDIMATALDFFERKFPDVFKVANIEKNFMQRKLLKTESKFYDTLYSIGATIELIHPSFDIISHMCRVSRKHIIILIQPNAHNYPRFYELEFSRHGFKKIHKIILGNKGHCLFHFIRENYEEIGFNDNMG